MDEPSCDENLESRISPLKPTKLNLLCAISSATASTLGGIALYEPTSIQEALTTYQYEIFGIAGILTVTGYVIGSFLHD